jgi:hypothetical protein
VVTGIVTAFTRVRVNGFEGPEMQESSVPVLSAHSGSS